MSAYLGKAMATARPGLPIPTSVHSISCVQTGMVALPENVNVHADIDTTVIAHRGCANIVRGSAGKADTVTGRKIPCHTGQLNRHQPSAQPSKPPPTPLI